MHVVARLVQINLALWGQLAWWCLVRLGVLHPKTPVAQRFTTTLERLGTTFVKLGQGLSLHRELLSDDVAAALQKLHDHVEPFSGSLAQAEIERSFGRPIGEIFATFDVQPLAAGSIAQVHRAAMPDGRQVVVKVRRPGIKRQVNEDVRILRWFLRSVLWLTPAFRDARPLEMVDELARNLHKEIDFRQETANIARFVQMFRGSPSVYIPGVVDDLYSDWVIVQEMSPGSRIDDPRFRGDGPRLAENLIDAYLQQFLVEGLFHGDPHPGNLFVLGDGRICFHDFGLVGFLDRGTRASLVSCMLALAQQDGEWLLDAYVDLGMLGGALDRETMRIGIEALVQDYARKPLRDWSFGEVFLRVAQLGRARNIRLPQHLLILLRAIFLMESTVRTLDPGFNLIDGLFAKAGRAFETSITSAGSAGATPGRLQYESLVSAAQVPQRLGALLHRVRTQGLELSVHHRGLDDLQQDLRSGAARIALALVVAGLYAGASMLMMGSLGPRWGDMPVLAIAGYVLAVLLTWRLLRGLSAGGARRH